jgi:hypothetical protein
MTRGRSIDFIELRAVHPDGDLACDTAIATPEARAGLAEDLQRGLVPPVRRLANGIEATFTVEARAAVMRYVELESQCCSFLDLAVRADADALVLTVTGRPEAREWIHHIFEQ